MSMSRKHSEALATAVRDARWHYFRTYDIPEDIDPGEVIDYLAKRIADVCAASNPSFDRERFLTACDIGSRVEQ